ncbi:MAG: sugar kinase [Mycobacterium sp.]
MTTARRLDTVTVGESLGLLTCDDPGRLQHAGRMRLGFGGAESNVAIGIARLGGAAGWIGRIGPDAVGAMIIRELRAEAVDTHAAVDPHVPTALMLKDRPYPGTSRVSYYRSAQAGSRLRPEDIPATVIAGAKILHITGISAALGADPRAAVNTAIDHAKSAGTLVSFDVNHRSSLWTDDELAAACYRKLAERADIVFAGDDEASLITGHESTQRQLDALLEMGARQAIVKRGHRGAVAATRDGEHESRPAIPVPVIDTVGAGDAFVAGWLAELARGCSLPTIIETAVACGALACTGPGDWEANPTREDLARLRQGDVDPVSR